MCFGHTTHDNKQEKSRRDHDVVVRDSDVPVDFRKRKKCNAKEMKRETCIETQTENADEGMI